jgi:citrate synthase
MSEEFADLTIGGKSFKLPIHKAAIGPDVIDVTKLYGQTGYFTYDPGFMSTASCTSDITYIDGDNGILRHRGYDIKDLADNKTFLDVSLLTK